MSLPDIGPCEPWEGQIDWHGYGRLTHNGKRMKATHFVLAQAGRALKPGEFACHRCDNTECVRLGHLHVGNQHDNMSAMVSRGRHYKALITPEDARRIYALQFSDVSTRTVADSYGLKPYNVAAIWRGHTWRSVNVSPSLG